MPFLVTENLATTEGCFEGSWNALQVPKSKSQDHFQIPITSPSSRVLYTPIGRDFFRAWKSDFQPDCYYITSAPFCPEFRVWICQCHFLQNQCKCKFQIQQLNKDSLGLLGVAQPQFLVGILRVFPAKEVALGVFAVIGRVFEHGNYGQVGYPWKMQSRRIDIVSIGPPVKRCDQMSFLADVQRGGRNWFMGPYCWFFLWHFLTKLHLPSTYP